MKNFILICILFVSWSASGFAQNSEPTPEAPQDLVETIKEEAKNTRYFRAQDDYIVLLNYSYLDLVLPSKYGLTVGLIKSASTTYELEYMRGSMPIGIDKIGSLLDERISLVKRSFSLRNSFNFSYGLSYFNFQANLNEDLLSSVAPSQRSMANLIQIQSLGFNFGISNRWTFHKYNKNFTFGIDWLNWSQPLFEIKRHTPYFDYSNNQSNNDTVRTVVNIFSYLPRFNSLKLQFGMSF